MAKSHHFKGDTLLWHPRSKEPPHPEAWNLVTKN